MDEDEAYRVLELSPGSSWEEVRNAYRDLARVWHPDRFGADDRLRRRSEERFQRITAAYETLRQKHEREGSTSTSVNTLVVSVDRPESAPKRGSGVWAAPLGIAAVLLVFILLALFADTTPNSAVTRREPAASKARPDSRPGSSSGAPAAGEQRTTAGSEMLHVLLGLPPDSGAITDALDVIVLEKASAKGSDDPLDNWSEYRLLVQFTNLTEDTIRALRGFLVVRNVFDEYLGGLSLERVDPVPAGEAATQVFAHRWTPFLVRDTVFTKISQHDLPNLKFEWWPGTIRFTSGNSLTAERPYLRETAVRIRAR